MKNSQNKGFTLIELLVVIAIIGILSSVVLASLTTARTKGQAAAVQSELSNMRAQAELYYSNNSNKYTGTDMTGVQTWTATTKGLADSATDALLMSSPTASSLGILANGVKSTYGSSAVTFYVTSGTWAVSATLPDASTWCVDSSGKSASSTINTTTKVCN